MFLPDFYSFFNLKKIDAKLFFELNTNDATSKIEGRKKHSTHGP
jgi:hypothetical protein